MNEEAILYGNEIELVFVVNFDGNITRLRGCLYHLRQSYLYSRVVVISNGNSNPLALKAATDYNAEFIFGKNYDSLKFGGLYWHRMLSSFLSDPSDFLVSIKTETKVWKPIEYFSKACIQGAIGFTKWDQIRIVNSGCKVIPRFATEVLFESNIFLDPNYCNARYYAGSNVADKLSQVGKGSEERYSQHAFNTLGIELLNHPQICCISYSKSRFDKKTNYGEKDLVTNPYLNLAITYPNYYLSEEN